MFQLKWWVVAAWIVILGILGITAVTFMGSTSTSLSIPGTAAQDALNRFEELFPDAGAQSGRVVVAAPEGSTITNYQQQITDLSQKIAEVPEVTAAVTPFENPAAVAEDGRIAYITVQLRAEDGVNITPENIDKVQEVVAGARTNGLSVETGGDLVNRAPGEILGIGEIGGVLIALLVLVITLGSLVAAGLPIITALITVGVSMAGLFSLSQVIELTNTAPVLAVMLGLAVGIDYSLFIINRYRTFVKEGYSLQEASAKAIATAGNAVIFAAATVVIALASLAVVQIPFMTVMGLAAAATVALAALIAVTLIPAMLGIAGMRIFGKKARAEIEKTTADHKIHETRVSHSTVWYRWGEAILKFRKTTLVVAVAIIALLAVPISGLQLGLPTDEFAAEDTSQRKAYNLMSEGFGAGFNGPLLVVAENLQPATDEEKAIVGQQIATQYQSQISPEVAAQMTPEQQAGMLAQLQQYVEETAALQTVANRIAALDGVAQAQAAMTTEDGTKGVIQVIPTTGPSDIETQDLVAYLRDEANQRELTQGEATTLGVTGSTAVQIDINDKLAQALPIYLAVVIGLSLVLLMVAFRSILIPIKATLGFLLSVLAMFGALVAVFQWGWFGIAEAPGPIVSFIPIIAIGILFGLAMDYEFFLVSGMQEAFHHTKDAKKSVLRGFALGSRVVVAAGLIMVAVFAGFIFNHDSTIQSIGFALALGILVDAFLVRLIIVPIIMSFLGKAAWWLPKWLDKRLPNVSIEGKTD